MGSKSSTPEPKFLTPAPPPAPPSFSSTIQDYINAIPQLVQAEQKFSPQLAQLSFDIQKQYAPQQAQLEQSIQEGLYPNTAKLQESLASQALAGMNEGIPQEFLNRAGSDINAQLGKNANAPIGLNYRSVELLNLQKSWGDYYRNLGLSTANRQPLTQPSQIAVPQPAQGGAAGALGFAANNYGAYSNAVVNQPILPITNSKQGFNFLGSGAGGALGALAGLAAMPTGGSSLLFAGLGGLGGGLAGGLGGR